MIIVLQRNVLKSLSNFYNLVILEVVLDLSKISEKMCDEKLNQNLIIETEPGWRWVIYKLGGFFFFLPLNFISIQDWRIINHEWSVILSSFLSISNLMNNFISSYILTIFHLVQLLKVIKSLFHYLFPIQLRSIFYMILTPKSNFHEQFPTSTIC